MKNKKGFTLVEILGVITILSVLALIAIPTIDTIVTKNREKLYQSQIKAIEDGLKTWGNANALLLPEDGEDALLITVGILKLAGFVDEDLKNPNTDLCFSNDMQLSIEAVKEGYNYNINEESGLDGTETDCSAPTQKEFIYLKGPSTISLTFGSTYVEPGFIVLGETGSAVTGTVTSVIKDKDGNTVTSIDITENSAVPYTITYTYGTATATRIIDAIKFQVYANGTAVYFNPVTGAKCTAGEAVSTTGTKTGCMKWYTFNDGGAYTDTINLILDHNTTAVVAWNSTGSNVSGPTNVMTQLQTDTSAWAGVPTRTDSYSVSNGTATYTINYSTYKARLIKASEIATITGNSSFVEATTPYTSWFYLDSNNQTKTATTTGASNYDWLFDYTNGCTSSGCNIADASNYGYWTSTAASGGTGGAWYMDRGGSLGSIYVGYTGYFGVRPVITILKSNL